MTLHAVSTEPEDDATSVYRVYDAEGALLYIGMSLNALSRLYSHSLDKPWWSEVARVEVSHFSSRSDASRAERRAIESEAPRHNVAPGQCHSKLRRRATREELNEFLKDNWPTSSRVECLNCGMRPIFLPRGMLVAEVECERCGCEMLELRSAA